MAQKGPPRIDWAKSGLPPARAIRIQRGNRPQSTLSGRSLRGTATVRCAENGPLCRLRAAGVTWTLNPFRAEKPHLTSRLQLAFELVEEAPVGIFGNDLLRGRVD